MENNENMLMDWNDSLNTDGEELIVLPEGDYNFRVVSFERGRFPGGAKIPACNKAIITVEVKTEQGKALVRFDLLLYRSVEFKISSFFRCIGLKKHGEKLVMDWNKVPNAVGRAHFKPKTYTNNYGEEKTINDLDKFIDYDPKFFLEPIETDEDLPF